MGAWAVTRSAVFFFVIVVGTGHGAKRFGIAVWRDGWMSYTDHRTRWVGEWRARARASGGPEAKVVVWGV